MKRPLRKQLQQIYNNPSAMQKSYYSHWGLKPDTLLWIFTVILEPRLTCASIVWWSRVKQKTAIDRLERFRGMILRGITGASKSSPTTALEAPMRLEPETFRLLLIFNFLIFKHFQTEPWPNLAKNNSSTQKGFFGPHEGIKFREF